MTRQPFSVAPAGPRKGFWKEDECMFSNGSHLAMLNPSSSHWQGASHRPNSASSLGLGHHHLGLGRGHPRPSMAPGFLCVTQTLATLGILSFWI